MPQLDPYPWFQIFLVSWLTLLMIVVPLTMSIAKPNDPESQITSPLPPQKNWGWPWI